MVMETQKYLALSRKILQNKLAMRGLAKASLFRLDLCVTWKCNSRCNYCKIWEMYVKNPSALKDEMVREDYEKLFDQLDISWLHVTGGEPFLKRDLPEILGYASEKANLFLIDTSTNGFLVDHTVSNVKKILEKISCKFIVGVSLDGPSDIHIESRGIRDGWNKTVGTYLQLREMKREFPNLDVHINHFISPMNMMHFDRFVSELKEKDIGMDEVSIEVARSSSFFMNESVKINNNKEVILDILKKCEKMYSNSKQTFRVKLRRKYVTEMMNFLTTGKKAIPCASGYSSVFIDPYGNVQPCSQLKIPVGNVKNNDIKEIMESQKMKEWREKFKNCQICWSGCEGITSIIQNLPFSLF